MQNPIHLFTLSTLTFVALNTPGVAHGIPENTQDPVIIMQAVFDRNTGDRIVGRSQMTIKDSSGSRERIFQSRGLEFEDGIKTIILFESPANMRNTGLLSVDYDDGSRQDDQWLYLPSLRKSTRIAAGGKSGSFVGSDFTYADLTKLDPKEYKLVLLEGSVKVDDEVCWKIEMRPATSKTRTETGYLKSHVWISKQKLLPVRVKAWIEKGKKLKYTQMSDIRKVDGVWTVHGLHARTVRNKEVESETIVRLLEIRYNSDSVSSEDFTERTLERGI